MCRALLMFLLLWLPVHWGAAVAQVVPVQPPCCGSLAHGGPPATGDEAADLDRVDRTAHDVAACVGVAPCGPEVEPCATCGEPGAGCQGCDGCDGSQGPGVAGLVGRPEGAAVAAHTVGDSAYRRQVSDAPARRVLRPPSGPAF